MDAGAGWIQNGQAPLQIGGGSGGEVRSCHGFQPGGMAGGPQWGEEDGEPTLPGNWRLTTCREHCFPRLASCSLCALPAGWAGVPASVSVCTRVSASMWVLSLTMSGIWRPGITRDRATGMGSLARDGKGHSGPQQITPGPLVWYVSLVWGMCGEILA